MQYDPRCTCTVTKASDGTWIVTENETCPVGNERGNHPAYPGEPEYKTLPIDARLTQLESRMTRLELGMKRHNIW